MIRTEFLKDGTLIRHWSDREYKMRQDETGELYDDAVDLVPCPYTYIETTDPIEY